MVNIIVSIGGGVLETRLKRFLVYSSLLRLGWMLSRAGVLGAWFYLTGYSLRLYLLRKQSRATGASSVVYNQSLNFSMLMLFT